MPSQVCVLVEVLVPVDGVVSLGVVLLELLTGKRAILLESEEDGPPFYLVDFAVPPILAGDLVEILDSRVGPPDLKEAEALKILAHTAIRCVEEEPRQRPTMNDIVVDLDRAFAICGSSLYDENFSYSIALPSHESNHMTPDPLDTDSCDIPIYEENTNS